MCSNREPLFFSLKMFFFVPGGGGGGETKIFNLENFQNDLSDIYQLVCG